MSYLTEKQQQVYGIIQKNPKGIGPTDIGLKLGYDYGQASSRVMGAIKKLVNLGLVVRVEKPVRYAPK